MKVNIDFPNGISISLDTTDSEETKLLLSSILKELPVNMFKSPEIKSNPVYSRQQDKDVVTPISDVVKSNTNGNYQAFKSFCNNLNPVGDMRRAVVAAEGAKRHLGLKKISPEELNYLFDYVNWQPPTNLVQTLRNAGRKSFAWIERVPGRQGYYIVTPKGIESVIETK